MCFRKLLTAAIHMYLVEQCAINKQWLNKFFGMLCPHLPYKYHKDKSLKPYDLEDTMTLQLHTADAVTMLKTQTFFTQLKIDLKNYHNARTNIIKIINQNQAQCLQTSLGNQGTNTNLKEIHACARIVCYLLHRHERDIIKDIIIMYQDTINEHLLLNIGHTPHHVALIGGINITLAATGDYPQRITDRNRRHHSSLTPLPLQSHQSTRPQSRVIVVDPPQETIEETMARLEESITTATH